MRKMQWQRERLWSNQRNIIKSGCLKDYDQIWMFGGESSASIMGERASGICLPSVSFLLFSFPAALCKTMMTRNFIFRSDSLGLWQNRKTEDIRVIRFYLFKKHECAQEKKQLFNALQCLVYLTLLCLIEGGICDFQVELSWRKSQNQQISSIHWLHLMLR